MVMTQQQARPQQINQDEPYQEPLPRALNRPIAPERFDDVETDWFWQFAYWMVGGILLFMGACALRDMFITNYNWLLALSWTSTAVMGIAGLALIQKYWIRR